MNYKNVMIVLGIITCLGTPIGLWIKMRVNNAEHAILIEKNIKNISTLEKENEVLRQEIKDTQESLQGKITTVKTSLDDKIDKLGDKVDEVPQRTLDLLYTVQAIKKK